MLPPRQVHNYLGREGTPPGDLLAAGRAELAGYGGEIVTGTVTSAQRLDDDREDGARFRIVLADGEPVLTHGGLHPGRAGPAPAGYHRAG